MKSPLFFLTFMFMLTSCSIFNTLKSNTIIKPYDSFLLGNNEHRSFKATLKNVSKTDLEVYLGPINGGKHSAQIVKPNEVISIKVDSNTALVINNKSADSASVDLNVKGDLGLSMTYKN